MKRFIHVTHASLDDAVSNFWQQKGAPEGAACETFIARQPEPVIAQWRAFLSDQIEHWQYEAAAAKSAARALESGPRGAEDDVAECYHLLIDEALTNVHDCQAMLAHC